MGMFESTAIKSIAESTRPIIRYIKLLILSVNQPVMNVRYPTLNISAAAVIESTNREQVSMIQFENQRVS